jgi:hypothetical protein
LEKHRTSNLQLIRKQNWAAIFRNLRYDYLGVILFGFLIVTRSWSASTLVPENHIDGAFQTASALLRLSAGEIIGRDFVPYLGIGPTLMILPLFLVSGQNLMASVFSAKMVVLLSAWIVNSLIWHLILGNKRFTRSLFTGALLMTAGLILAQTVPISGLGTVLGSAIETGNSLRPLRAFLPFLIAGLLYLIFSRGYRGWMSVTSLSIVLSLNLFWSNDYAYTTFALSILFISWWLRKHANQKWIGMVFTTVFGGVAFWFLGLYLLTQGNPLRVLEFNFNGVASDQWWYFGPYDAEHRIFALSDLPRLLSVDSIPPLVVLLFAIYLALKTRRIGVWFIAWIGFCLLLGGAVASVGGHLDWYFIPFSYWGVVTTLTLFIWAFKSVMGNLQMSKQTYLRLGGLTIFVSFLTLAIAILWTTISVIGMRSDLSANPQMVYVDELGGYLPKQWGPYLEVSRDPRRQPIVEEYWGISSAVSGSRSQWKVDSVIHALGDLRQESQSGLADARTIVSSRFWTSPDWQAWSVSYNYWFYKELFRNWEVENITPKTVMWRKAFRPFDFPRVNCEVDPTGTSFGLPGQGSGFFEVHLGYSVKGNSRALHFVQNNISYAVGSAGYVSVDPRSDRTIIPVQISAYTDDQFGTYSLNESGPGLQIMECRAYKILNAHPEVLRPHPLRLE